LQPAAKFLKAAGKLRRQDSGSSVLQVGRYQRNMAPETYTVFVASSRSGAMRRVRVPFYALYALAALAAVGGITVAAALGSYTRLLWKAGNYNALLRKQGTLERQYHELQQTASETDARLSSLQSLATEVAMTYGFIRLRNSPFAVAQPPAADGDASFDHSLQEYAFLESNSPRLSLAAGRMSLLPTPGLGEISFTPTLWPVIGRITGSFGERLDPFSGEGAFHTGVDISSQYGDGVRAAGDGVVVNASVHAGYGRLVVVDHGFGVASWYGHLSSFTVAPGMRVKRGDLVGYVGVSGRTTGPHVHYEVRINGAPVNPMRYLRNSSAAD
jgi:murein DD-endopeptidase MepM/ murein hydrolase activator NlpD